MLKVKPWSKIQFKLVQALSFGKWSVKLMSDQLNGNILTFSDRGVYLISGIGGSHGFSLDNVGRLKPYRGKASDRLVYNGVGFSNVSSAVAWGRTFYLWVNADAEQIVINSQGYNMLLVDKAGVHRFPAVPASWGLPVDEFGNLRILK